MRLQSLALEKFGHFSEKRIDFDAGAKIHIVLGPNEAGKSTLRKAWLRFLFSYDQRKEKETEAYGYPNEDLSLEACFQGQKIILSFTRPPGPDNIDSCRVLEN